MSRAQLLEAYLFHVGDQAFHWREWNCCSFVAGWVRQFGVDVMAGLPGTGTRHAAHRLIGQLGGSLQAAWTRQLGREPIESTLAQMGDVVLVEIDADQAVGICCGRTAAVLTPADGVAHVPMSAATAAWRVA